jgi:hypothetical protein
MTADSTAQREKLRATHRVRLVKSHEEGFAAAEVPVGVYGFTSSAGLAAPLFAAQHYRNFEMHHLPNGEIAIVGFVAPEDARPLATATAPVTITIFPEIEGQATAIVAIAYSQIVQHRQYAVRNAAGILLQVTPEPALL